MATPATVVDEYIARYPESTQAILHKIRRTIRGVVPEADEVISYGVPAFKVKGKSVVFFGGYAHHVSVYPIPAGDPDYQAAIAPYVAGKGTLKFPLDKPIPYAVIEQTATLLLHQRMV